jgi:hypothetical protein
MESRLDIMVINRRLYITHQRIFLDPLWGNIFEKKHFRCCALVSLSKAKILILNIQTSNILKSLLQIQNLRNQFYLSLPSGQ